MRGFLLAAVLLAACGGDGTYLEIRVPAGMAADQVELYLGTGPCAGFACTRIVPPLPPGARERMGPPEGEVYFVDNDLPFLSIPDEDGSAWFHLDPSTLDVGAVIAVAHEGPTATGVAIFDLDLGVTEHVVVDLTPIASQIVEPTSPQPAVEAWSSSADHRCVVARIQNRTVAIVPGQDPDCDELEPATGEEECLPDVYLGKSVVPTALRDQTCPVPEPDTGLCVLGGNGCDETDPLTSSRQCVASSVRYCVPDRVCENCPDLGNNCFPDLFADPSLGGATHIVCTVEVEPDPQLPARRTCPNKIPIPVVPAGSGACSMPRIAFAKDRLDNFGLTLPIQSSSNNAVITPVIVDGGGVCGLGIAAPNATFVETPAKILSLVQLQIPSTSGGTPSVLILPLEVVFVDTQQAIDCATSTAITKCRLIEAPDEHLDRCFQ